MTGLRRRAALVCLSIVSIYGQDTVQLDALRARAAHDILRPGQDWVPLGAGYQLTSDSAVDPAGRVYFTDARRNRILRIDPDGRIETWKEDSHGSHGVAWGPDGRLYAGQHDRRRVVAFAADGTETVVAEGLQTHHLTVTGNGRIYAAAAPLHRVWLLDGAGPPRIARDGLDWPRGVRQGGRPERLMVGEPRTPWIWSFRMTGDGVLDDARRFCRLETRAGQPGSDAGGLAFDTRGWLYVATELGIQVCDPRGRLRGLIAMPGAEGAAGVFFAGPGLAWLYVTDGDRLYRRPMRRRGVIPGNR